MTSPVPVATFTNAIDDHGRTCNLYTATEVFDNYSGDETLTYPADAQSVAITAFVNRYSQKFIYDKCGFAEKGDSIILVKSDQTIKKNDIVKVGTIKYIVREVLPRDAWGGTTCYKSCNAMLWDN
jgi:hypothetical protein